MAVAAKHPGRPFDGGSARRYPPSMLKSSPLHVLLAAGPDAAGIGPLVERAGAESADGRAVRVLLSGGGLEWASAGHLGTLPAGSDVAVCSQNARSAGWSAESTPAGVRWSSVATWLAEIEAADEPLWIALP